MCGACVVGKYNFIALEEGLYRVCFSNKFSTVTSKTIEMNIIAGQAIETDVYEADKGEHTASDLANSF